MKIIVENYTFDASAGTVEFDDYGSISQENIFAVVNVTDGVVIYSSATPAKGGTVATNVLTLEHDTSAMSDTDDLQIFYWDANAEQALPAGAATSANQTTVIGYLDGVEGLLTTIDGDTGNISTKIDTLAGAVAGSEIQADIVSSALPTGASTSAAQTTGNNSLASIDGKITTVNTGAVVVSSSALPSGASTSALQTTGNTSLATIAGAVAGTEMQVDVLTMPTVTVTATNLDVQSGGADLATSTQAAAIQTAVEIIDNAISGNEMQVDVVTMPTVTINAIPAGTNNIGDVDVLSLPALPAGTNSIGSVSLGPSTSGGLSTFHLASAGSTNATNVKASAGQVFGWYIYNSNAAARKVVFHNTAGTPTAGASVFFSLMIPPTSGANVEMTNGIVFSAGIAITTVTGLADSDSAAVAANDLIINIFYK